MKKIKLFTFIVAIFTLSLALASCDSVTHNEIYNNSYEANISITEFENLIETVCETVSPSVVGVSNYQTVRGVSRLASVGSGVVYDCKATLNDGTIEDDCSKTINSSNVTSYEYYVITNKHVIEDNDSLKIYLGDDDEKVTATLIQADEKVDIAVIKFSYTKYIQVVKWADSNQLKRGQFVIAIGNPSGYEFYGSATLGIVSFPARYISEDTDKDGTQDWAAEYIQHDAAINPGNSGGGLFNIKGELIGINTLKLVDEEIDGMGFAIPSNIVKSLSNILSTGVQPKRVTLGISGKEVKVILNPEDYGLSNIIVPSEITYGIYVESVDKNGSSNQKLLPGDFILKINNIEIQNMNVLRAELLSYFQDDVTTLYVYRDGKYIDVEIKFV